LVSSVASELLSLVKTEIILTLLLMEIRLFFRLAKDLPMPAAYCVYGLSVMVFILEEGEPWLDESMDFIRRLRF
jgi:hypothetical protein